MKQSACSSQTKAFFFEKPFYEFLFAVLKFVKRERAKPSKESFILRGLWISLGILSFLNVMREEFSISPQHFIAKLLQQDGNQREIVFSFHYECNS